MLSTKIDRGEDGEHGADPELDAAAAADLARLGAALAAVAAQRVDQARR